MADLRRLDEARQWLQYAADDLETAEMLIAVAPAKIRQSLFAAQQAAEKALKAFLIHEGQSYPLTHNLLLLANVCSELDESLRAIIEPALPLTDFAVRFRYPGAAIEEIEVSDARCWVGAAHRVLAAVRQRMAG